MSIRRISWRRLRANPDQSALMATLAQSLKDAQKKLINTDTAILDAQLLLSFVLNCDRSYLFTWPEKLLTSTQESDFEKLIQRRVAGEPIAYLTGKKEFWSLMLEVDTSTLIPRPETELLVELALGKLPETSCDIMDLGTGTGAIALALAQERPLWRVFACDANIDAVTLAKRNADNLKINNITLFVSNWFDRVEQQTFDLIVSNPPYIDEQDIHLKLGDLRFEPKSALVADNMGFADIEKIITQSTAYLRTGGWLMLEHGFAQAQQVRACFSALDYVEIETVCDLAGHERVTMGKTVA